MSSSLYIHSSVSPSLSDAVRNRFQVQDFSPEGDLSPDGAAVLFGAGCVEIAISSSERLAGTHSRVFVSGGVSGETERLLLGAGISRYAEDSVYLRNLPGIFSVSAPDRGSVLILGAGAAAKRIISSIAETFGCVCVFADTLEDAVSMMNDSYLAVIHDLSCADIPLLQFSKRMSHSALRSLPYISYKSSGQRIDINDLQSGIRKYTRVILSLRECYVQTASILFKREYYPLLASIYRKNEKECAVFADESLKKIFFTHHDVFFPDRVDRFFPDISDSAETMDKIRDLCGRFSSFSGLMNVRDDARDLNGAGV
jgi:hypothetical protein